MAGKVTADEGGGISLVESFIFRSLRETEHTSMAYGTGCH